MSLPETIELEKNTFKPHLKYNLGDQVFLKTDKKKEWPMLIVDFDTDEDMCSDYYCRWMNTKGETEQDSFPGECLIK